MLPKKVSKVYNPGRKIRHAWSQAAEYFDATLAHLEMDINNSICVRKVFLQSTVWWSPFLTATLLPVLTVFLLSFLSTYYLWI